MKNLLTKEYLQPALLQAWRHVQAKSSAPGLDGIDIGDYQADAERQLDKLLQMLLDGTYSPEPVRIFTLRKGTKEREQGVFMKTLSCTNQLMIRHPFFAKCHDMLLFYTQFATAAITYSGAGIQSSRRSAHTG